MDVSDARRFRWPPWVFSQSRRVSLSHGHVCLDGGKLRRWRIVRGLSVDALAALTGGRVPARQLYEYEAGRRRCDPARFAALCRVLGVTGPQLSAVPLELAGLAEWRHWAGLTADQAAERLGMSSWSLLRVERTGRLPRQVTREGFLAAAAGLYACSPGQARAALARTSHPRQTY
ncbi:helix-turn-helix domain-containing protein [Actinomadura soli]|uniref:Helix-turn-helix domain-containing protein n=1 Tax=Actinomadura soli TaxID=2508997 RepID=A0A5C4JBS9_9ACTN|nr:helix-turn-helix domain-containing protein [Actinomadura soli]